MDVNVWSRSTTIPPGWDVSPSQEPSNTFIWLPHQFARKRIALYTVANLMIHAVESEVLASENLATYKSLFILLGVRSKCLALEHSMMTLASTHNRLLSESDKQTIRS